MIGDEESLARMIFFFEVGLDMLRYRLESFILDSTRMTCPALLPHDLYSVAALTILEYPKNKAQHFIH